MHKSDWINVIDKSQLATSMYFTKYFSDIQMHRNDKLKNCNQQYLYSFRVSILTLSSWAVSPTLPSSGAGVYEKKRQETYLYWTVISARFIET